MESMRSMLLPFILMWCIIASNDLCAQQDDISEVETLSLTKNKTFFEKISNYLEFSEKKNWIFLAIPVISYAPETKLKLNFASQLLFRPKGDTISTPSNIDAVISYSFNGQIKSKLDWKGYFFNDKIFVRSKFVYESVPSSFYGFGSNSSEQDSEEYSGKSIQFKFLPAKEIKPNFWAGIGYSFNNYFMTDYAVNGIIDNEQVYGREGYRNSGLIGMLKYDKRNNKLGSSRGFSIEVEPSIYTEIFGSTHNNFSLELDYRHFISPKSDKHTLGWQIKTYNSFGKVPFQELSSIGGSSSMRGYSNGRYRDLNAFETQLEYRFPIWKRFTGATFVASGDVYDKFKNIELKALKASFGGGIRYKLDKNTNTSIRLDYARSRDGTNGFYIEILEAF